MHLQLFVYSSILHTRTIVRAGKPNVSCCAARVQFYSCEHGQHITAITSIKIINVTNCPALDLQLRLPPGRLQTHLASSRMRLSSATRWRSSRTSAEHSSLSISPRTSSSRDSVCALLSLDLKRVRTTQCTGNTESQNASKGNPMMLHRKLEVVLT